MVLTHDGNRDVLRPTRRRTANARHRSTRDIDGPPMHEATIRVVFRCPIVGPDLLRQPEQHDQLPCGGDLLSADRHLAVAAVDRLQPQHRGARAGRAPILHHRIVVFKGATGSTALNVAPIRAPLNGIGATRKDRCHPSQSSSSIHECREYEGGCRPEGGHQSHQSQSYRSPRCWSAATSPMTSAPACSEMW